jgi:hypothetical protein
VHPWSRDRRTRYRVDLEQVMAEQSHRSEVTWNKGRKADQLEAEALLGVGDNEIAWRDLVTALEGAAVELDPFILVAAALENRVQVVERQTVTVAAQEFALVA